MAADGAGGLKQVLEMLVAGGAAGDGGALAGQADMFEAGDAPLPLGPPKGRSGPRGGRPLGARNKSTDMWAQFILSSHRSPLSVLADLYSRPLDELVDYLQDLADRNPTVKVDAEGMVTRQSLRINPLDVLKLQRDAAVALAPYLHQAQPKAVQVTERPRGVVVLADLEDAEIVERMGDDLALAPIVEHQRVIDVPPAKSDVEQSDIPANALIHSD